MASRTKKGNVTAEEREKSGGGKGVGKGKFPIFDEKSCLSAIKLRGHSPNPGAILSKASAWASKNNSARCKAAVEAARS